MRAWTEIARRGAVELLREGNFRQQAQRLAVGQGYAADAHVNAYYLTDLLYLDGNDLSATPLERRKALLTQLVARVRPPGVLRVSEHVASDGAVFHREACRLGLPGMISRRADARAPAPRGSAILVRCAPGRR